MFSSSAGGGVVPRRGFAFIGPPGTYPRGPSMHEDIRCIHAILAREGPLDTPATRWLDAEHGAVVCGLRQGLNGMLLVAANFDTQASHRLDIPRETGARWSEAFAHGAELRDNELLLAPGGAGVWKLA